MCVCVCAYGVGGMCSVGVHVFVTSRLSLTCLFAAPVHPGGVVAGRVERGGDLVRDGH